MEQEPHRNKHYTPPFFFVSREVNNMSKKKIKTMPQILTEILEAAREASEDINRKIDSKIEDLTEAIMKLVTAQQETVENLEEMQKQIERLMTPILKWLKVD